MTEQEWMTCTESATMLKFVARQISTRKRDLFFCTVLRLIWKDLGDQGRRYVEVKERFADNEASEDNLKIADLATAGHCETWSSAFAQFDNAPAVETALLRHIIGNPFRPYPAPASVPEAVLQLADALYNGEDCGFALHDALLETGHPDLADHFRQEQHHPKGCWVLDLILDKS